MQTLPNLSISPICPPFPVPPHPCFILSEPERPNSIAIFSEGKDVQLEMEENSKLIKALRNEAVFQHRQKQSSFLLLNTNDEIMGGGSLQGMPTNGVNSFPKLIKVKRKSTTTILGNLKYDNNHQLFAI